MKYICDTSVKYMWLIFTFQLVQLVLFLRLSNLLQSIAQKVMNGMQDQVPQEELLTE